MLLVRRKSLFAVLLTVLGLAFTACTDDAKQPEEAVQAGAGEGADAAGQNGAAGMNSNFMAETVYFAFDSSHLDQAAQSALNKLADHLKSNATAAVEVAGHCDERGTIEYNLALGERRAATARDYLVRMGVDAKRVTTISYGEERPAVEGHTEDAWAKNRRAEFTLSR